MGVEQTSTELEYSEGKKFVDNKVFIEVTITTSKPRTGQPSKAICTLNHYESKAIYNAGTGASNFNKMIMFNGVVDGVPTKVPPPKEIIVELPDEGDRDYSGIEEGDHCTMCIAYVCQQAMPVIIEGYEYLGIEVLTLANFELA